MRISTADYQAILARQIAKGRNTVIGDDAKPPKQPKRLRQSAKAPNKLEQEWIDRQRKRQLTNGAIRYQPITLTLAAGCKYTPDVMIGMTEAHEVKGPHSWDDSIVKLKVAARIYPEIRFFLVWKEESEWHTQHVIP